MKFYIGDATVPFTNEPLKGYVVDDDNRLYYYNPEGYNDFYYVDASEVCDVLNYTPHVIGYKGENMSEPVYIEPVDPKNPVRVSVTTETVTHPTGFKVVKSTLGKVTNLPEPRENVYIIVSSLAKEKALQENPSRTDLLSPSTNPSDVVRNAAGQVEYVTAFSI